MHLPKTKLRIFWLIVFAIFIAGCANRLAMHSFSFDADDHPGIEILDYRYGESRQPSARPSEADKRAGDVRQSASITGDMVVGEDLYVLWRVRATGKKYEQKVDLAPLLPRDMRNHRIHFSVNGERITVFLITPERRGHAEPSIGPRWYSSLRAQVIFSGQGREVQ